MGSIRNRPFISYFVPYIVSIRALTLYDGILDQPRRLHHPGYLDKNPKGFYHWLLDYCRSYSLFSHVMIWFFKPIQLTEVKS